VGSARPRYRLAAQSAAVSLGVGSRWYWFRARGAV